MTELSGEVAYLFRHAMVREGAYQLILPENRRALHRLALEILTAALDSLPADTADAWAGEMADHAMIAAEGADDAEALGEREFGLRLRAGRLAQARFELRDALGHFERALHLREDVGVLCDAGEAAITASRYESAGTWAGRALELAKQEGAHEAADRALVILARVAITAGEFERAHDLLGEALELAKSSGDEQRVSMIEGTIGTVFSSQGKQTEAAEIYRAGVAHARATGDERLLASALNHLADAEYRMGHFAEARQSVGEGVGLLRKSGELSSLASSLARLSIIAADLGDRETESNAAREAEQLARRIGYERLVAILLGNRGTSEFERGNMREAARLYRDAEKINREIGHQLGIVANITNRGGVLRETGDLEGALACADEALALARAMNHPELAGSNLGKRGVILLALQRYAEARESLEEGIEILRQCGIEKGFDALNIRAVLADACWQLGDQDTAREHADDFRKLAGEMQVSADHHNPAVREGFARVDKIG